MNTLKILVALAVLAAMTSGSIARAEDQAGDGKAAPHDHAGDDHAGHDHAPPAAGGANHEETLIEYLVRKSDEAFHQGDYDRVIGLNKAIIALEPDNYDAYGGIAWLLWSMGRGEEAVQTLDRGLKANPNSWEMWDEAGKHYDLQKLSTQSLAAYTRALQLIPKEEDSHMLRRRLAHAAEKAGDWTTSLATWQGLVRDFPNDAVNKNNLARVEKAMAQTPPAKAATLAFPALLFGLCLPAALRRIRRDTGSTL